MHLWLSYGLSQHKSQVTLLTAKTPTQGCDSSRNQELYTFPLSNLFRGEILCPCLMQIHINLTCVLNFWHIRLRFNDA